MPAGREASYIVPPLCFLFFCSFWNEHRLNHPVSKTNTLISVILHLFKFLKHVHLFSLVTTCKVNQNGGLFVDMGSLGYVHVYKYYL